LGKRIAYVDPSGHIAIKAGPSQKSFDVTGENPIWGPGHSRIAFVKDAQVWIMNDDGTNAHAITHSWQGVMVQDGARPVSWSDRPIINWKCGGHQAIAFVNRYHARFGKSIGYVTPGGCVQPTVIKRPFATTDPSGAVAQFEGNVDFAPTGTRLAFGFKDPAYSYGDFGIGTDLFLANGQTHAVGTRLVNGSQILFLAGLQWSPDSTRVLFGSSNPFGSDIEVVNTTEANQTPTRFYFGGAEDEFDGRPSWQPLTS